MAGVIFRLNRVAALLVLPAAMAASSASGQMIPGWFSARFGPRPAADAHAPIRIISRPMVKRYQVPLSNPRRVITDRGGNLFVADWSAGTVLKVTPEGTASVIAEGLNEPAGLYADWSGNLYLSQHARGLPQAGSILRIAPGGESSVLAEGLTGPSGITMGASGDLYVANFHDSSISRITPSGEISTFAEEITHPGALVFSGEGDLYAVSSTEGTVIRIGSDGRRETVAGGFLIPSDISLDSEGRLIVTNFGGTRLSRVTRDGQVDTYALVPHGTISCCFDPDGNLLFVNWDRRELMKVTSHLSVPCPHCSGRIPIRLVPPESQHQDGSGEDYTESGPV